MPAMQTRASCWLVVAVAFAASLAAQSDDVDEFIRAQMRAQNIPALSLAIVKDGQVVKAQGYGLANRERKIAATPDTVFKIASVSKQFIAAGIMLLVQDGKLRLDEPIAKYLDQPPAAWQPLTVRHLLTHTSGLVREAPGFSATRIQADADVIRSEYGTPLQFAPGTTY